MILGISNEEGDALVQRYLRRFPTLHDWMKSTELQAKRLGKVRAETGRIRHMPRAVSIYERHGDRLLDSLALWKDYHQIPELYEKMKKTRRELKNYIANGNNFQIQSRVASMMNLACIAIAKEFKAKSLDARIVAQIHDEIVVSCNKDIQFEVSQIIQRNMENAAPCTVPMIAIPSFGTNFRNAKGD
jgi:DNA polymerase-1